MADLQARVVAAIFSLLFERQHRQILKTTKPEQK
jgi:hypothetical protein